jgi:hypothetical protein
MSSAVKYLLDHLTEAIGGVSRQGRSLANIAVITFLVGLLWQGAALLAWDPGFHQRRVQPTLQSTD